MFNVSISVLVILLCAVCMNGLEGIDLPDQEGEVDGSVGEIEYKIHGYVH